MTVFTYMCSSICVNAKIMETFVCFICIAVASITVLVQPAIAQGANTNIYPAQILQGNGNQTCHSEGQRERVRNEVDSAMLHLLQETVVPRLQNFSCGGSFGWRRVAYLDMSDPSQQCPSVWREITTPHRTCGRGSNSTYSCDGVTYTTGSQQYDHVCGRIIAYQVGDTEAFRRSSGRLINAFYVDGISVTRGSTYQHIWTFAAGLDEQTQYSSSTCPCVTGSTAGSFVPSFVGQNYFCEAGITRWTSGRGIFWPNGDPLWDGQRCGLTSSCCTFNSPPWFNVTLSSPTTDYIEIRICTAGGNREEDTPIQLMELYVK